MKAHLILFALLSCPLSCLLPASAMAASSCSVNARAMDFGAYDPFALAHTDSVTAISVTCTLTTPPASTVVAYSIMFSAGSGGYGSRTLLNGSNTMAYDLYTNATMSPATSWGDGSSGTGTVSNSLPLTSAMPVRSVMHNVYGRIPAGQDVAVGNYNANIVITMNF